MTTSSGSFTLPPMPMLLRVRYLGIGTGQHRWQAAHRARLPRHLVTRARSYQGECQRPWAIAASMSLRSGGTSACDNHPKGSSSKRYGEVAAAMSHRRYRPIEETGDATIRRE